MEACIPLEANEASEVPLKSHLELQKSFLAYLAFAASDKDN